MQSDFVIQLEPKILRLVVSLSPFGLDFGTFGLSDFGLGLDNCVFHSIQKLLYSVDISRSISEAFLIFSFSVILSSRRVQAWSDNMKTKTDIGHMI